MEERSKRKYAFESYQAKKVKMQSMERILTTEMSKYNDNQLARNLVFPVSALAKEKYSPFLLTNRVNHAQAGFARTKHGLHKMLERPITVNTLSVYDVFHSMNGPVAFATDAPACMDKSKRKLS